MKLVHRRTALALFASAVVACDREATEEAPTASATAPDHAGERPTAASSAPAAPTSSSEVQADPLATFFTRPPDANVVFLTTGRVPHKPVTLRLPPGWPTPHDEGYDLPWTIFAHKHRHARIYVGAERKAKALSDAKMKLGRQHIGVTDAVFEEPVRGHFGASKRAATIARGAGTMNRKPAEVWYALVELDDEEMLVVFASLRKDVYPKLEGQLHAVLRSMTFNDGR